MGALLVPELSTLVEVLIPRRRLVAIGDFDHRDAVWHRTDDLAEVATDALGLIDDWSHDIGR